MSDVFGLSPEHEELRSTVERFARTEVAPVISSYYEAEQFPYPLVAKMGEMGLFGLPFPEEYGGMGGDYLAFCLALEELARVDSSLAITLEAGVGLGAMPIWRFGSESQRREWLPRLCRAEVLGAFGLTEPGGGSDAGAIRTTARLEDGEWVINGTKAFITNSGTAITGFVAVAAVTSTVSHGGHDETGDVAGDSPGAGGEGLRSGPGMKGAGADDERAEAASKMGGRASGRREISTIIVPAGTPGLTVAPGYSKVGWLASDTHELSFNDVRVPEANLLGERGRGYAQFLQTLDEGRIAIAALSTGLAQGCIDEALRYLDEREAFGRKLARFQALRFKVADMEARAHSARLCYRDAARRMAAGAPFKKQAAIAKLVASDAAMANSRDATQIFGGYGYINETPVARFYRDAKILEIGEGTSEVQRILIARELGLVEDW